MVSMSSNKRIAIVGGTAVLICVLSLVLADKWVDRDRSQEPVSPEDPSSALVSQGAMTWGALEFLGGRGRGLQGVSDLEKRIREDMDLRQRIISHYRSEHPELKQAQDEAVMDPYLSQMVSIEREITEGEIRRYYDDNSTIYSGQPYRRVRTLIETKLKLKRYLSRLSKEESIVSKNAAGPDSSSIFKSPGKRQ